MIVSNNAINTDEVNMKEFQIEFKTKNDKFRHFSNVVLANSEKEACQIFLNRAEKGCKIVDV